MLKHYFRLFFCSALLALTLSNTHAQQAPATQPTAATPTTASDKRAGQIIVVQVTGEVYIYQQGETVRFPLKTGSLVNAGQVISTGAKASTMLAFSNGATVTIGEDSIVSVEEFLQKPFGAMFKMAEATKEPSTSSTRLNLVRGEVISNVKKLNTKDGSTFEIKTPVGIAGIRGTTFRLAYRKIAPKDAAGNTLPETASKQADFSLEMLEGTIEMTFASKGKGPRSVMVPQGKQLTLNKISIDEGEEGATMLASALDSVAPIETKLAQQAGLMQRVQTMLSASSEVSISATPGYTPTPGQQNVPTGNNSKPDNKTDNTTKSDDVSEMNATPPPQNAIPRLSPTDGRAPL